MTLAVEDANSKHVEDVSVADVDAEKRVDCSLVQIWKLKFCHKAKLLFRLWAQGLVKVLKLKLRRDFEAEFLSIFWCWFLVKVVKLNHSKASFGQFFEVLVCSSCWCLVEILRLVLNRDSENEIWSTLGSVVPLAMFFKEFQPERKCYIAISWFFLFPQVAT